MGGGANVSIDSNMGGGWTLGRGGQSHFKMIGELAPAAILPAHTHI